MPYKVMIDGVVVECATAQEAQELAKLHAAQSAAPAGARHGANAKAAVGVKRSRTPLRRAAPAETPEKDVYALMVLRAIEAASKREGIDAPVIVDLAKLSSAKGSGSFMTYVRGRLQAMDYTVSKVFTVQRRRDGRRWLRGPQIRQAIAAFEELAAERKPRPNGGVGIHVL